MLIWDFNLRHLRAAVETARLGSISAAAHAVSLSQPAVTQALYRLEEQMGLPLFDRHPGGMSPTEATALFVPRIDAALAHIASVRVTMAQVRALIALADAGSYVAAAEECGLAQPTLHRSIGDLSIALRRSLTERRGRGVALSESGRRTARAFRLARAELEAGLSELASLKGRETGRIAIGAMPLSRARLLPAAVTAFLRQFPEARVELIEGSYAELIEPLLDGALDLLVGALRPQDIGTDLHQRALFSDQPVILGRHRHPLAGRAAAPDIAELSRFPWIVPARGTPLRTHWEAMFTEAGMAVPPVPVDCGSVMMIRQILLDSDYLTLLSADQVSVELEAKWLSIICTAPEGTVREIGMTTRTGWRPTAMQKSFVNLLESLAPGVGIRKNL